MCKILIMSGITDQTRDRAKIFIEKMGNKITGYNQNNDGLGYAAITKDNLLFGERWLNNKEAFNVRTPIRDIDVKLMNKYKGALYKEVKYNSFGTVDLDNIAAITLHARMATSGKEFFNTHPFIERDEDGIPTTSLIHNGVIRNTSELVNETSTCDSECILNEYTGSDVTDYPGNIQEVAESLQGYYVCGVFSRLRDGNYILDIFKDTAANLKAAFITELDTLVFSTSIEDIEDVCREMSMTIEAKYDFMPGLLLRVNPITGDHISSTQFEARYKTRYNRQSKIEETRTTNKLSPQLQEELKKLEDKNLVKKVSEANKIVDGWVKDEKNVWRKT